MVLIPYADPQPCVVGGNPMPRLPFVRHLTERQIQRKYRACRHPVAERFLLVGIGPVTNPLRPPTNISGISGRPSRLDPTFGSRRRFTLVCPGQQKASKGC